MAVAESTAASLVAAAALAEVDEREAMVGEREVTGPKAVVEVVTAVEMGSARREGVDHIHPAAGLGNRQTHRDSTAAQAPAWSAY